MNRQSQFRHLLHPWDTFNGDICIRAAKCPSHFFPISHLLLKGLEYCSGAYLDDIIIFRNSCEDNLKHIRSFLGHHVGLGKVEPLQKKVDALLHFPGPLRENSCDLFLG